MAQKVSPTPKMGAEKTSDPATPENWEMRLESQTPKWREIAHDNQSPFAFGSGTSFDDCFNFDMYETPPGAQLYRDQFNISCNDESYNMSYQEEEGEEEEERDEQEESPIRKLDLHHEEAIPDESNRLKSIPDTDVNDDVLAQYSPRNNYLLEQDKLENGEDGGYETSPDKATKFGNQCEYVNSEQSTNLSSSIKVDVDCIEETDCSKYEEKSNSNENIGYDGQVATSENEFVEMDLEHNASAEGTTESFKSVEELNSLREESSLNTVEESKCRVETNLSSPTSSFTHDTETASSHIDCADAQENEVVEAKEDTSVPGPLPSSHINHTTICPDVPQDVLELHEDQITMLRYSKMEDHAAPYSSEVVCHREPNKDIEDRADPHFDEHFKTRTEKDNLEYQEKQSPATNASNVLPICEMNSTQATLASMDIPQDVKELDQLADFLSMDDLFNDKIEKDPKLDINKDEERNRLGDNWTPESHEEINKMDSVQPVPVRGSRRKKRTVATNERRRSVRIACRQSLLPSESDSVRTDIDAGKGSKEPDPVPHPFPEVGQVSPIKSSLLAQDASMPINQEAIIPDYLNAESAAPKTRKRKTTSKRRRSVRIQRQDTSVEQTDHDEHGFEAQSAIEHKSKVENNVCDSGFLADFADFGLGDNWMPGELFEGCKLAKTPKLKSGRRKSARLSGVPVPLLELETKSTIHVLVTETQPDEVTKNSVEENTTDNIIDSQPQVTADVASTKLEQQPSVAMDLIESLGDLPFEGRTKSSRRKKGTGTARRRSVRLTKNPQVAEPMEVDPPKGWTEVDPPKIQISENAMNIEQQTEETAFTKIKTEQDDLKMGEIKQFPSPELNLRAERENSEPPRLKKRPSRDTPMFGRKRSASRIKDKENDEPLAQAEDQVPSSVQSEGRAPLSTQQDVVTTAMQQQETNTTILSSNNSNKIANNGSKIANSGIKITKKIKQLYLNKGPDIAKHKPINLETIFESPARRPTGTPLKAIGGRKVKRCVAFTETPWLGRPGKTKGRKVKKGKQVKRILSSRRERCWKLDARLSSLDEFSL